MLSTKLLERRAFMRRLLFALPIAAATARACRETTVASLRARRSSEAGAATAGAAGSNVLLVYFSRPGENYYYGDRIDLEVGNTRVVAGMISDRIDCDVYEITAADSYPDDYEETRQRNVHEQDADARPEIANPLGSIDGYDTVILGSPIWNVRPPMIMSTFAERLDFTGKVVFPLVTYAVSGMGNTERVYQEACPGAALRGPRGARRGCDRCAQRCRCLSRDVAGKHRLAGCYPGVVSAGAGRPAQPHPAPFPPFHGPS